MSITESPQPIIPQEIDTTTPRNTLFHNESKTFTYKLVPAITLDDSFRDQFGRLPATVNGCSQFFSESILTEFGITLSESIHGRNFIDLGCGSFPTTKVPRALAFAYGATSYTGVDTENILKKLPENHRIDQEFPERFVCADMLSFLSELPPHAGYFFLISGIEPLEYPVKDVWTPASATSENTRLALYEQAKQYIDSALCAIQEITASGDGILIGSGTREWYPEQYGFVKTVQSGENKLFVKSDT